MSEATPKRKRAARTYLIQRKTQDGTWDDGDTFPDTRAALKAICEGEREAGRAYRVVAVCWQGTVKTETKTVTRLEARG